MQIEFTYELGDLREARVPERFAARPERYARRWIRVVVIWSFALAMMGVDYWLAQLTAAPRSPITRHRLYDARTELAPAVIGAVYVLAMYILAIRKNWRALRNRESLNSPDVDKVSRLLSLFTGMLVGAAIYLGIFGRWNLTWRLTPIAIVLLTFAPWAVLIVFMQVLGVIQRRAQTVGVWRGNAGMRRPKTMTMDETNFRLHDARYKFNFNWQYFDRVRETKNLLILVGEGGTQYLIPKRAFADPGDLERCRSLLQNVIPNCRFLVSPSGFAVLQTPVLPLPELIPVEPIQSGLTPPREAMTIRPTTTETGTPT